MGLGHGCVGDAARGRGESDGGGELIALILLEPSQCSDDEREDGRRVKGVRLFDESDFERFLTLVDSPASEWKLAGGPAVEEELKPEEVRVEQRPCPKGQYFDVFRVTTVVDCAAFCGIEKAVEQISSVLLDSAYRKQWDTRCARNGTVRIGARFLPPVREFCLICLLAAGQAGKN